MMHPSDEELLALDDGELAPRRAGEIVEHVADCAPCATLLNEWRQSELRTIALLSALDRHRPDVSVNAVLARARRSSAVRGRPLIAASVALIVLATAAIAAVPGSAFRTYLERVFAAPPSPHAALAPSTHAVPAAADRAEANGIEFVPESTAEVVFRRSQASGAIHITLRDSPAVRIEHYAGSAGYALTATGVVVENAGSRASYTLLLPRTGHGIVVRVGNRTVFARTNDRIATAAAGNGGGGYVFAFTQLTGREP